MPTPQHPRPNFLITQLEIDSGDGWKQFEPAVEKNIGMEIDAFFDGGPIFSKASVTE